MMSAPIWFCTAIERSGDSMMRDPSMNERNSTPSSLILVPSVIDHAWNPPESVRIGFGQRMNEWLPPKCATRSAPGRSIRW